MSAFQKAPPRNRWLSNQTNSGDYPLCNLLTNATRDHMANGSINDADGYRFKTDWNGSTNYMRMTKGDISSKTRTNGLYLYTSDTIGKDRDLWIQYYNLYEGPLSRNVIGFTGMWRPQGDSNPCFRRERPMS